MYKLNKLVRPQALSALKVSKTSSLKQNLFFFLEFFDSLLNYNTTPLLFVQIPSCGSHHIAQWSSRCYRGILLLGFVLMNAFRVVTAIPAL